MVNFNEFDYQSIFNVVAGLKTITRSQLRFLTAEIIERTVEKYSGGQLKYVGDNTTGMDFIDNNNIRYECKSRSKMFGRKDGYSAEIILKNFYRKSSPIAAQTYDHILLLDSDNMSMGIATYEDSVHHHIVKDSIITTKISLDKITYFAENIKPTNITNFGEILDDAIINFI